MKKLTEREILEKWAHIAMKVFPPQTQITPASAGETVICVRWRAENDPNALSARARGVDLHFHKELLAEYLASDAETELKWDAFIENSLGERLRDFDPYKDDGGTQQVETWQIDSGIPAPAG